MLPPETQTEILSLHFAKKMKIRAIARKLGINRKSVERVISRRSVVLGIQSSTRPSILDPFKERISEMLKNEPTISAKLIMQNLRDENYSGGYTVMREWVKAHRIAISPKREAYLKIDFPPGQTAQVDWGEFGNVFGDGIKIHCFLMVLCYSRLLYIEFTRSEKFEDFVRCHENGFRYFEGLVPEIIWYDNLPAAVSERVGPLIRFNARFFAYAGHHHFAPHACNKGKGNEKGRVEEGVKYIRLNFWTARKFMDFPDINRQGYEWRDLTANLREHRNTKKIPRLVFEAEERDRLLRANPEPYDNDEVFSEKIRPDYHIVYDTNQYSVPWTLVAVVVTVRIDADWIKIYYRERFVCRHSRCYLKHQKPFTNPEHEKGLIEIKPQGKNAHLTWQIQTLQSYGPALKRYLECLRYSHRSLKQEISQLLALATVYGEEKLEEAVAILLKRGSIGVDQIELVLKRTLSQESTVNPTPLNLRDETLARIPARVDIRRYDELLFPKTKDETHGTKDRREETDPKSDPDGAPD